MDPNEPINSGGGVGLADKPTNPVSGIVPEPSVAAPSTSVGSDTSNDLSDLQRLVNAAKEQVPTDSQNAFVKQFGPAEGATPVSQPTQDVSAVSVQTEEKTEPAVAETPSSSVAQLDPSIKTVDDLLTKGPQVVETQSEVKLPPKVQEFLDSVLNAIEKYKAPEEEKIASP